MFSRVCCFLVVVCGLCLVFVVCCVLFGWFVVISGVWYLVCVVVASFRGLWCFRLKFG